MRRMAEAMKKLAGLESSRKVALSLAIMPHPKPDTFLPPPYEPIRAHTSPSCCA